MSSIVKTYDILLPNNSIDAKKWGVVACDQFTSQPNYWKELESFVEGAYSTFDLIYPEVYLDDNREDRISRINENMKKYLNDGIFKTIKDSFILVERDTPYTQKRLGIMLSIDLEQYDYTPFANVNIRATEGTVVERIPPRVEIRRNAPLELPHIMLLIDDRSCSVIEPLYENRDKLELLYDTDLNMNGGHIRGYRVSDTKGVIEKLYALLSEDNQLKNYGKVTNFLFAVGDGNHSLATAKKHWDNIKTTLSNDELDSHPARYALVEVENLMSPELKFEPIHRVIFNAGADFIKGLKIKSYGEGEIKLFDNEKEFILNAPVDSIDAIKVVQDYIDEYLKTHKNASVDYIHGEANLKEIIRNRGGIGILMPTPEKTSLFDFIIRRGIMPRKSFSMGEAEEKRYYFEAKKITY